ncbi:DUF1566 domain-containing protein [Xanthomonadaceae bacterium JHOS43]|nr:DUF1566 domain-containing protein [Xanthomonadaceae bacterium JHOS43]
MATNFPMNPWLAASMTWLLLAASGTALAQTCPTNNRRVAPDTRYTVTAPGPAGEAVVTDTRTGLMWKQCREGQSGATCTGTASTMTWSAALTAAGASTHAGFGDWRLPNAIELQSLVESGCYGPAINTTMFPNPVSTTSQVWSSSTSALDASGAWYVDFGDGSLNANGKLFNFAVRLVRGGQWLDPFSSEHNATPDAFDPVDQNDVPVSSQRTSAPVAVSGLATVTGIDVSGAAGSSYSINSTLDVDFTSAPGVVKNGDMVRVRHTSAATAGVATTTTLIIGGVTGDFVTTTGRLDQLITFGTHPGPVTYGDTSASVSASADSGLGVGYGVAAGSETLCAVNASTGAITTLAVGNCIITANQPGDANYNPAPEVTQTVQITPLAITVTANATSKTYGESDPPLTYGVTPALVNGDSFSGNLTREPGENAGVYDILQGSLTAGDNYAITFHGAVFTIHKATQATLVASATPGSILFNETSSLSTSGGSGGGAVSYAVTAGGLICDVTGNTLTGIGLGTCTVTATKAADANHLAATATVDVTVTPKADLEIAKDANRTTALVGDTVVYSIVVSNVGPNDVVGASVIDNPPGTLVDVEWTCVLSASSIACPAAPNDAGEGAMSVLVNLPAGAHLRYDLSGTVQAVIGAQVENTANVAVPVGMTDPDGDDNSSTASVLIVPVGIFADGFETGSGLLTVPAAERARARGER